MPFQLLAPALDFADVLKINDDEVAALVNVGSEKTNLNIVRAGIPLYTKDVPIGAGSLVEAVAKQLEKLPFYGSFNHRTSDVTVALASGEGHFMGHGGARHSTRDRKRRYRKRNESNENGSNESHGLTC